MRFKFESLGGAFGCRLTVSVDTFAFIFARGNVCSAEFMGACRLKCSGGGHDVALELFLCTGFSPRGVNACRILGRLDVKLMRAVMCAHGRLRLSTWEEIPMHS